MLQEPVMLSGVILPLLLFGALALALLLAGFWLRRREGRWRRPAFGAGIAALGLVSLVLSFQQRLPGYLLLFVAFLLPLLRVWQERTSSQPQTTVPPSGRVSLLQTPWLLLRIAHDDGGCTGQLLRGPLADWRLHELDRHDLRATHTALRAEDPPGLALLEVWLDRHGPPDWRVAFGAEAGPPSDMPSLDRDEATQLLGVDAQAEPTTVKAAAARLRSIICAAPGHEAVASWIAAAQSRLTNQG